jgi:hypothetical protein
MRNFKILWSTPFSENIYAKKGRRKVATVKDFSNTCGITFGKQHQQINTLRLLSHFWETETHIVSLWVVLSFKQF